MYGSGIILFILGFMRYRKKEESFKIFLPISLLIIVLYSVFRYKFSNPYEIPTSVFQSVNAMFIIIFGTIVSGFWYWRKHRGKESSSLFKMAIGTIIMGMGFLFMAKASSDIVKYGDKAALILLILAYWFHTIGELCASPVALSFITKIAPIKYVSIMMGVYFAATGLGNKVAGAIGESSQAQQVKVSLIENPTSYGVVSPELYNNAKDFEIVDQAYVLNNKINFTTDKGLNGIIGINEENKNLLIDYLSQVNATAENPQTIIARYSYDKDKLSDIGDEKLVNAVDYSGNIEVFEFQNKLEHKTFINIFILSAVFGVLLLLFLKKLKSLTHGPEDDELDFH
ncbi:MAG: hypothetical protein KDC52_04060 [Ignavibacteriae bacterium]|nr:hypothetical protein [Ignavibacteriota bacterium]